MIQRVKNGNFSQGEKIQRVDFFLKKSLLSCRVCDDQVDTLVSWLNRKAKPFLATPGTTVSDSMLAAPFVALEAEDRQSDTEISDPPIVALQAPNEVSVGHRAPHWQPEDRLLVAGNSSVVPRDCDLPQVDTEPAMFQPPNTDIAVSLPMLEVSELSSFTSIGGDIVRDANEIPETCTVDSALIAESPPAYCVDIPCFVVFVFIFF